MTTSQPTPKTTSNIGITGVGSIRLRGMKIDDLPIAEAARIGDQLRIAEDNERQMKVDGIVRRYQHLQATDYYRSKNRESEKNVKNFKTQRAILEQRINEYQGTISLCEHRDRKVDELDADHPLFEQKKKQLFKEFPPYNVDRCKLQIEQDRESIARFDDVIAQENKTMATMIGFIVECQVRDDLLKNLGVQVVA